METVEPPSPASTSTEGAVGEGRKPRQKGEKTAKSDLELLRATADLMPSKAPSRQKNKIWEKVAERVSVLGVERKAKYCSDRVRDLLKDHRADRNKLPPTGDAQKPPLTDEQILLDNIDAADEEAKTMSDTQKEKALEENHLARQLEDDALKSFSKKSRTRRDDDDEWVDVRTAEETRSTENSPAKRARRFISPKKRTSPWKTASPRLAKRQHRDDLFREKFAKDAEIRVRELQDKEAERQFQKEMAEMKNQHETEERDKEREYQRQKDQEASATRRAEIDLQKQGNDLLKELVVALVKKNL